MPRHPYAMVLPYNTAPSEVSVTNCGIAVKKQVEMVWCSVGDCFFSFSTLFNTFRVSRRVFLNPLKRTQYLVGKGRRPRQASLNPKEGQFYN